MAVTSEQTLTQQQRATFWALADILIPATDSMPAASEAGSADKWLGRALAARPDLVPAERPAGGRLLGREDREAVRRTWQRFLDYLLALDAIGRYYHSRGIVSPSRRGSWPSSRPRGLRRAVPIRPRLPGPAGPRSGVRRAARPLLHPDTVPNSLPGGIPAEAFEASDVSRALRVAGEVIRVVKGKRSKGGL